MKKIVLSLALIFVSASHALAKCPSKPWDSIATTEIGIPIQKAVKGELLLDNGRTIPCNDVFVYKGMVRELSCSNGSSMYFTWEEDDVGDLIMHLIVTDKNRSQWKMNVVDLTPQFSCSTDEIRILDRFRASQNSFAFGIRVMTTYERQKIKPPAGF